MELLLQDPAIEGETLDEKLIDACAEAHSGVGVFAFASSRGVNSVFDDPVFRSFAANHRFELIVGMSAVTDPNAIAALVRLERELHGLRVEAFITSRREPLFHPKMCWFSRNSETQLFVGSGNLTLGGLRSNWEACLSVRLPAQQAVSMEDQWRAWKAQNSQRLFPLSDERVQIAAERNRRLRRITERAKRIVDGPSSRAPLPVDIASSSGARRSSGEAEVFLTEVPRSGDRWKQVNFPRRYFEEYFGARAGRRHRVLFTHVSNDGVLGETEVRPSVSVASQNYRFELNAAAGIEYPTGARPIAVFLKLATRQFGYLLCMPDAPLYEVAQAVLHRHSEVASVRRALISDAQLGAEWPQCPLLLERLPLMDVD